MLYWVVRTVEFAMQSPRRYFAMMTIMLAILACILVAAR